MVMNVTMGLPQRILCGHPINAKLVKVHFTCPFSDTFGWGRIFAVAIAVMLLLSASVMVLAGCSDLTGPLVDSRHPLRQLNINQNPQGAPLPQDLLLLDPAFIDNGRNESVCNVCKDFIGKYNSLRICIIFNVSDSHCTIVFTEHQKSFSRLATRKFST